jgi:hypothetical protein
LEAGKPYGLPAVWQRHAVQGQPVHTGFLALALLAGLSAVLITFLRWYLLVRAVALPFRVLDALRLGFIGYFFNTFLPGSVGGDVLKAAFLAREQDRRTTSVATALMDRAIALWALVWFVALLARIIQTACHRAEGGVLPAHLPGNFSRDRLLLGLLPGPRAEGLAGSLSRLPRVGPSAADLWRAVWMYRCQPRSVGTALALSWMGHALFVLLSALCAKASMVE